MSKVIDSPAKVARSALHESPMNKVRVQGDEMMPTTSDHNRSESQTSFKGRAADNNIFVGPDPSGFNAGIQMTDLK